MQLRPQLITFLKDRNEGILGVELQKENFRTTKGGYFSAESIIREARRLSEEGRLTKRRGDKNLIIFEYKFNKYEQFHNQMSI